MREEYFGSTYLYCAHPWKLEEEEEEEEEEEKVQILDYIFKNAITQKKTNKKEVILWVQECLSLQSERQRIGRV